MTTITREDGSTQAAHNGIPLYDWAQDQVAGDATGQGIGDVWLVVAPGQQLGEVYSFVATNTGKFSRETLIALPGERAGAPLFDADGREAAIERIDAGTSATLEQAFTGAGTYQLTCPVRGHYAHGMADTITVVE